MKGKGCGCKSMRNGGVCMRCGGKAKYNFGGLVKKMRDGGEIRKYADGGEVVPPEEVKKDLQRLREARTTGIDRETAAKLNGELMAKYGENSNMLMVLGQAIHEAEQVGTAKGPGYDMKEPMGRMVFGLDYLNDPKNFKDEADKKSFGEVAQFLQGKTNDISLEAAARVGGPMTLKGYGNVPTGTTGDIKSTQVTAPGTMKEDRTLPNWGRLKNEQVKLNQLIQNDTSADKPKLLDTDDVLGNMTRSAMEYYEKKGAYKRPELFSEANVEQYKKNAAAGIGIGGVKTVQGEKTAQETGSGNSKKLGKGEYIDEQGTRRDSDGIPIISLSNEEVFGPNYKKEEQTDRSFKGIWGKPTGEVYTPPAQGTLLDDVAAEDARIKKEKNTAGYIKDKEGNISRIMKPKPTGVQVTNNMFSGVSGKKEQKAPVKYDWGMTGKLMSGIGMATGQGLDAIKGGFQQGLDMIAQLPKKPLPQSKEGMLGEIREIRGVLDRMYSSESKMDDELVNKLIDRKAKLEEMYGGPVPEYNEPTQEKYIGKSNENTVMFGKTPRQQSKEGKLGEYRELEAQYNRLKSTYRNSKPTKEQWESTAWPILERMGDLSSELGDVVNKKVGGEERTKDFKSKVAHGAGVSAVRDMIKKVWPNISENAVNQMIKGYEDYGIQPHFLLESLRNRYEKQSGNK